jgi:hypothetical protein
VAPLRPDAGVANNYEDVVRPPSAIKCMWQQPEAAAAPSIKGGAGPGLSLSALRRPFQLIEVRGSGCVRHDAVPVHTLGPRMQADA